MSERKEMTCGLAAALGGFFGIPDVQITLPMLEHSEWAKGLLRFEPEEELNLTNHPVEDAEP